MPENLESDKFQVNENPTEIDKRINTETNYAISHPVFPSISESLTLIERYFKPLSLNHAIFFQDKIFPEKLDIFLNNLKKKFLPSLNISDLKALMYYHFDYKGFFNKKRVQDFGLLLVSDNKELYLVECYDYARVTKLSEIKYFKWDGNKMLVFKTNFTRKEDEVLVIWHVIEDVASALRLLHLDFIKAKSESNKEVSSDSNLISPIRPKDSAGIR